MSEADPPEMPPDQQEAQSIRYSSLIAVALLESGRWAVYSTVQLDRDSFRNQVEYFDSFPMAALISACDRERTARRAEEAEYEARLALGDAVEVETMEDL